MQPSVFVIHEWRVDTSSNQLIRGDSHINLEHKVMAVLRYLAGHHGEVVSREQLESAVWGNTVVGYDALTRCIAKLRKSLDDDPRNPRYIETISKKGYRLIVPISYPAAIDKESERSAPGSDNDLAGGSPPTHYRRTAALAIAIFWPRWADSL